MCKTLKKVLQWIAALLVSAVIMNFALSLYDTTTGWIDRDSGATSAIYTPNSRLLMGTEGRGYQVSDSRGYVNSVDTLADNYIIAFGSSFTQGREVNIGERYSDIINTSLGYTDTAYVYNVSQIHYFLPQVLQGFTALLQEFPDADKVIIETWSTYFTPEELADSLNQRPYDETETGENILSTLSLTTKIKILAKEHIPLLSNIGFTLRAIKEMKENEATNAASSGEFDLDSYKANLDSIFALITSNYGGEIIMLFHPKLLIQEDGTLIPDTYPTDDIFRELCAKYNITLVDMTDRFLQEYNDTYTLPYGFSNTFFGDGHFNANGHRMVAEELIKVLQPEEDK